MFGQSPPTTSGVVIISGSNGFDPITSDFGVVVATITDFAEDSPIPTSDIPFIINDPNHPSTGATVTISGLLVTTFDEIVFEPIAGFVPDFEDDVGIISTPVTTSGVVIMDIFPGAGAGEIPFVPPIYLNERLFPINSTPLFVRVFPEEGRRIFPTLPQDATLTPGD